jgi:predicted GH43/DUF377 family glycosyl hydrolase
MHFSPNKKYVSGPGWGGCEDPRITKIDDKLYVTYVAFNGYEPQRVALTSIDLTDFRSGNWNWSRPALLSRPGEPHKNWTIFPEKIKGKYAILHSINPELRVDYFESLDFKDGEHIESCNIRQERMGSWDTFIRGVGPPPIKTSDGWLLLYHAMQDNDWGRYKIGAMMLEHDDPQKVLYRSRSPLMEPDTHYENNGLKPGVVYATGAVTMGDMLFVYYGGSDTTINVAYAHLKELTDSMKHSTTSQLISINAN